MGERTGSGTYEVMNLAMFIRHIFASTEALRIRFVIMKWKKFQIRKRTE